MDFLAVSKTFRHLLERRLANTLMFFLNSFFMLILNVSSVSDGDLDHFKFY